MSESTCYKECNERRPQSTMKGGITESCTTNDAFMIVVFVILISTTQYVLHVKNLLNGGPRGYIFLLSFLFFVIVHIMCRSLCIFLILFLSFKLFYIQSSLWLFMPFTAIVKASDFFPLTFAFGHLHQHILCCNSPFVMLAKLEDSHLLFDKSKACTI